MTNEILAIDIRQCIFRFEPNLNTTHEAEMPFIKSRTLFVISCFRSQRRVSLAKNFFFSDRAQIFFGRVSSNFPTFFFFCPVFFFFFIIFIIIPPFTPRTNGDYLLRPRTRYKKSKDMPWKVRKWSR